MSIATDAQQRPPFSLNQVPALFRCPMPEVVEPAPRVLHKGQKRPWIPRSAFIAGVGRHGVEEYEQGEMTSARRELPGHLECDFTAKTVTSKENQTAGLKSAQLVHVVG